MATFILPSLSSLALMATEKAPSPSAYDKYVIVFGLLYTVTPQHLHLLLQWVINHSIQAGRIEEPETLAEWGDDFVADLSYHSKVEAYLATLAPGKAKER